VKGRKRHIVTDTDDLLLAMQVHTANIQDVHGAVPLLKYRDAVSKAASYLC
jgi:putative transposase